MTGTGEEAALTLTEELLLVAFDDAKGIDRTDSGVAYGLAGALLAELTLEGHLREDADGKLTPASPERPADPLLAAAFDAVAGSSRARSAGAWVRKLPSELSPLPKTVAKRLSERGVLDEERSRLLGRVSRTRYPQADPEPERALRARLEEVLLEGRAPTAREALLAALLRPYRLIGRVVGKERRRDAERRAKEIEDRGLVGSGVSDAVEDEVVATMAAVVAGTVAATTADGGG